MIERKFINEKVRDRGVKEFIASKLKGSAYSHTDIEKTPLGYKLVIHTSKPGLVVGAGGQSIKSITNALVEKFKLENPQVEVSEVKVPELDAQIMSERVAHQLQRWGVQRFKKIGYSAVESVMNAGAKGVEIRISGKVPGKRATTWTFRAGYLPKNGFVSDYVVNRGLTTLKLKQGVIGVKVRILESDVRMPDEIDVFEGVVLEKGGTEKVKNDKSENFIEE